MEHWVEYPPNPSELTLAWRAPDGVLDRMRWAVGVLSNVGPTATFRYLRNGEFKAENRGKNLAQLTASGFRGYPTFDAGRSKDGIFAEGVLEAFLRRMPPAARPDFPKYLELYRYRGIPLAPMSLLALTTAKLPSDGFSLVDRLDPQSVACDTVLEIAGFRYRETETAFLRDGVELQLIPEPTNPYDSSAVKMEASGVTIGYVNRLQTRSVAMWLKTRVVSCWLLRRSGRGHSPLAFAFMRMRSNENLPMTS
ncbi:HIRAN domain-containing protein [Reyranella sp. CPCC 100927]|uniref:HIRAN domain-containing protein n=1 Tax=Reyranella sp. CPCC 100927 TaxID=2599616 RepID=UPI0011B5FA50|nr:hypothetical protein FQU96_35065 [Reyranella sp. CPCC 100927]